MIIVIAAILALVLLTMCVFFICVRRNSREADERSPFPALSTSSLQFEDKEAKSQAEIQNEESNNNYLINQTGNIYKFQPSFDTTLNRTIKSTQHRRLALPDNCNDEPLSKTTHVYLNSNLVRNDDEQNAMLRASSMRLNLPQQYEAKIN